MRVRIEEVGGVPTRYYHEGSGPPLLLVHGVGVTADTWLRNIDSLAQDFAVYAPDLLDNGYTGQGGYEGGPPQPHMIDHLAAFADHLGLDAFAVCGSSFGGLLAALLHLRMPERVTRLILLSSGTLFNSEAELARTLAESYANGMSAIADPSWENCRRRMERIVHDPETVPPEMTFAQLTLYAMPGQREAYERRMKGLMDIEACRPYRVAERLEEISAPTLMIWGRDDPRAVMKRAEDAAARIPTADLVVFEHCRHHPHVEQPDRFNDLARRFLKGQALADAA